VIRAERQEAVMEERHATLHVLPPVAHPSAPPDPDPRPAAEPSACVRVHVVGADPLALVGLRTLLELHPGIRVTGESAPGERAVTALRTLRPHVLVLHGPLADDRHGLLARAAGDDVRVLTVGADAPAAGRPEAVHGHLPGTAAADQLASAVVLAAAGYTLVQAPPRPEHPLPRVSQVSPDRLTEREQEVVELIAQGLSNGEIAASLTLSEHTVKTHVQNLLHKLRLRSRVHAAIYAFEAGLRRPG
jgi:DNA-binding NarL/FixJ family response regulator